MSTSRAARAAPRDSRALATTTRDTTGRRREEILAAAVDAFDAKGYGQVSLQEIAEKAGITKAAIYHYFARKEDLLVEALQRAGDTLASSVVEVAAQDLQPVEKLRQILRSHVRVLLSHRALCNVYFNGVSQLDRRSRDRIVERERRYAAIVTTVLEAGIENRSFRKMHPRASTLAILGMCTSALRWYSPQHGLSIEQLADEIAEIGVRGVLAPG